MPDIPSSLRLLLVSAAVLAPCAAGAQQAGQPPQAAPPARLNPTGRDIPLGGPLVDNGFVLGEVSYVLKADDSLSIEVAGLLALLSRALDPAAYQDLAGKLRGRATVSDAELRGWGYPIVYDPQSFQLSLALDPAQRPRQVLSVSGSPAGVTTIDAEPEEFSAYTTILGNFDYVHRGADTGFADPNLLFDSAVRYRGFVLENEASWQGDFVREGTRLVYDDRAHTARYAAGDLRPISRGFSSVSPMAGLSMERVYADLDPQKNIQPRGQRSFTITRASTVETFVNGTLVQQTRLNPGTYDVRDFPFAQGANDVRLVVRDDSGRENVINFSINFDRTLLAAGLSEYGLYAGVQTPFDARGRTYSGDPVASGFYRRGFSDELTAGGNFQATDRGAVVGTEIVWASPLGTLGFDLAGSKVDNIGSGYAINIGYEYNLSRGNNGGNTSSLIATLQKMSRDFSPADALFANNPYEYELGLTYSLGFARDHFASLDGFYSKGRGTRPDQVSLRALYGWRVNTRLFMTSEASYQDRSGESDWGIRFAITYRFTARSSGTAEFDTRREGVRMAYQTSSGRGVGSYNAQGAVDYFEGIASFNGNVNVLTNRAELGAAHLTSYSNDDKRIIDQRTSLRVGTSIALAGDQVALSRPIFDSFAMLKPHETLKGAQVYISPNEREYLGKSGAYGPGVQSDLSSYTPQLITYDVPKAPIGYDIGAGAAQLLPGYRSGYVIEVGSAYAITYAGQLLKADGAPLALAAGEAYELARPDRAPVQMFTNRAGRFAASGLRAGRWRIDVGSGAAKRSYFIEIPADAEGLIRGDALRPEDAQ